MKKIVKAARTGERGVNLIQRTVLEMGCMWYPTGGTEAGIDGTIEILDPVTDEATNQIITVQSKATSHFSGETQTSVEYLCREEDLRYWLQGNTPVILVYSCPDTDEAYWVSLKDYFADPRVRATRKVRFDKRMDRFDAQCRPGLERIAIPKESGLYLGTLPKSEIVFSDLLPVRSMPQALYTAQCLYSSRRDLFSSEKLDRDFPRCWTIHGKILYSFDAIAGRGWDKLCDVGTAEKHHVDFLAASEEPARKNLFVELLNITLVQQLRDQDIWFNAKERFFFDRPDPELRNRKTSYNSRVHKATRTTFSAFPSKDGTSVSFYRHSAFFAQFYRFDGRWYLRIEPTYHFTSDGYRQSAISEAALSGIKRLENNQAVHGQVLMWARILQKQTDWKAMPRKLFFADPLTFTSEAGFDDQTWLARDADSAQTGEETDASIQR